MIDDGWRWWGTRLRLRLFLRTLRLHPSTRATIANPARVCVCVCGSGGRDWATSTYICSRHAAAAAAPAVYRVFFFLFHAYYFSAICASCLAIYICMRGDLNKYRERYRYMYRQRLCKMTNLVWSDIFRKPLGGPSDRNDGCPTQQDHHLSSCLYIFHVDMA
jgi:hypothetical protein